MPGDIQSFIHQKLPEDISGAYVHGSIRSRSEAESVPAWEKKILLKEVQPGLYDEVESSYVDVYDSRFLMLKESFENPLTSSSYSKTLLLPHQVEAAITVLGALRPRFLIADEVGLGKTIEAGLILKELMLKYQYRKVLICVPAPLQVQWQSELKEKFQEDFIIVRGRELRKNPELLAGLDRVIISQDLAKYPHVREKLAAHNFEIVIFDEAHRLRRDQSKVTLGYQLAERLSENCEAILLLSATPFRGKLEEIYYTVALLDGDILGPLHTFLTDPAATEAKALQRKLAPVVIRRRKVDIGGFTKRFARTVRLNMHSDERAFYDAVTSYVKRQYNQAIDEGNSIRSFVMITFQKLLDSSRYALLTSLARRRDRLHESLEHVDLLKKELISFEDLEDSDDPIEGLMAGEERQFLEQTQDEIVAISKLLSEASSIDTDSKYDMLEHLIEEMQAAGHSKFLIFSQFKSTVSYLAAGLKEKHKVEVFHGGLSFQEKEEAIARFQDHGDILLLTEAGGEGRNLQVASILINYDLPWSPLKIEQRIGRIHRFGQKRDCHVINFACSGTVAERVLEVLEDKIKVFESAFGESDTLIGVLEEETTFKSCFRDFLNEKKTQTEVNVEIDRHIQRAKKAANKLNLLLSPDHLKYNMQSFSNLQPARINHEAIKFAKASSSAFSDWLQLDYNSKEQLASYSWGEHCGTLAFSSRSSTDSTELLAPDHLLFKEISRAVLEKIPPGSAIKRAAKQESGVDVYFEVTFEFQRITTRFYKIQLSQADLKKVSRGFTGFGNRSEFSEQDKQALFEAAVIKGAKDIFHDHDRIEKKLRSSFGYWKAQIESSAESRDTELKEKIDLQKSDIRWHGTSQGKISALSRVQNSRAKAARSSESKLWGLQGQLKGKMIASLHCLIVNVES